LVYQYNFTNFFALIYKSSVVQIGNIAIGNENPIRVQSMATTNTLDTKSTVNQIISLAEVGCEIVRVTTRNIKEAENIEIIKKKLLQKGFTTPIIADVHYNPKVAEVAAKFADKVRINPGNYIDNNSIEIEQNIALLEMEQNLKPLLKICKKNNTAIRIGVNHGSLSKRILYKHGNTAMGMVESLMEFVHVCKKHDFKSLVLSLKASNVSMMIEANILLVKRLNQNGDSYAIHLGVTEAGNGDDARIKSASGIGYLLSHGIGDTIRVSLTESPLAEIPVAKKIVDYVCTKKPHDYKLNTFNISASAFSSKPPFVITTNYSNLADLSNINLTNHSGIDDINNSYSIHKLSYTEKDNTELLIKAAIDATNCLIDKPADGIWIDNNKLTSSDELATLSLNIFQVLGLRITKTEFIACPTCGRSSINVIKQLQKIKQKTSHLPGLKIAIMGCSVNGPGEMADANYGFVGSGKGKVNLYGKGKVIYKNVDQEIAVKLLIDTIKANGDWIDY